MASGKPGKALFFFGRPNRQVGAKNYIQSFWCLVDISIFNNLEEVMAFLCLKPAVLVKWGGPPICKISWCWTWFSSRKAAQICRTSIYVGPAIDLMFSRKSSALRSIYLSFYLLYLLYLSINPSIYLLYLSDLILSYLILSYPSIHPSIYLLYLSYLILSYPILSIYLSIHPSNLSIYLLYLSYLILSYPIHLYIYLSICTHMCMYHRFVNIIYIYIYVYI